MKSRPLFTDEPDFIGCLMLIVLLVLTGSGVRFIVWLFQ